jgi:hypothetical protein
VGAGPVTEDEFNRCTDPQKMLAFLRGRVSDRKLRLFAVACCRRFPALFSDEPSRNALDLLERFSDGRADAGEFWSSMRGMEAEIGGERASQALVMVVPAWWRIMMAVRQANLEVVARLAAELTRKARKGEPFVQSQFVRDIFGPLPFHPVALDPVWQTPRVVALAQAVYDEQAFDGLPVLADALEEAGCTDQDVLGHCRGPGPHTKGCWVVDALLGRG